MERIPGMEPLQITPEQAVAEPELLRPNRRRCARQRVHSPAYVGASVDFSGSDLDFNEVLDISDTGLSFRSPSPIQLGHRVKLCLDLPETGNSIRTVGRVVWSDPSGRTGVQFLKLRGLAFSQLKEWLFLNALVACAHAAGRANHSKLREGAAGLDSTASHRAEIGTVSQEDYAAILSRLSAVQREAKLLFSDLEKSLQQLAGHALRFTGSSGAALALAGGEHMMCRASVGSDAPGVGTRFHLGSGFSGECVRRGVALRCDDSETDPRVDREICRSLGIRSMLAVPIRADQNIIGLLEVFSREPRAFRPKDRVFLQRLAEMVPSTLRRSAEASAAGNGHGTAPETAIAEPPNPLAFEESAQAEVAPGGPADSASPSGGHLRGSSSYSLRRIGWVAAAVIILASALLVPSVRNRLRHMTAARPQAELPPQAGAPVLPAAARTPENEMDQLRRLAQQGDPAAEFALGAHYATGEDVKQNYATAASWFEQAADHGHVAAQATLGAYYWAGTGVPKNLDRAYFWSVLAQAGGDEASKYRISGLTSQMTRGQIIAAQEEANDWLQQHELSSQASRDSHP